MEPIFLTQEILEKEQLLKAKLIELGNEHGVKIEYEFTSYAEPPFIILNPDLSMDISQKAFAIYHQIFNN